MKMLMTMMMSLTLLASCSKLTTANQASPIVFNGVKAVDTTSKGTAILTWDQPRGAVVAGFEIFFEDLTAAKSEQPTTLKLADETSSLSSQDVPAILVTLPDEQAPVTTGKLLRTIDGGVNSFEIPKLLPGRYAVQVKAVGADGSIDTNQRVAIIKVESTLGYEGIAKAEVQGPDVYLEWPQLETTLTSREVVYTIYEGATFANPVAITTTLNFKVPLLGYSPGTVLYFGVRSTDAKGRTDRNVKSLAITVPSTDSDYEGCVSGEARGSDRVAVNFVWPKESYQTMNILRDGVQVFSTADQGITSYVDAGLQEGEAYTYTCLAVYKSRTITGLKALKITTLTSNAPTFKGIASVDILSPHSAILKWGVSSGVPASTFNIYVNPGLTVDWNADPVAKIDATTLEWTTNDLGDDLTYAFGVRSCSVKNVCDFNTIKLTGVTGDDGVPKTVGATALAVIDAKLRVTAPWIPSQGGINKRFIYMKGETATPVVPAPTFVLVATVAVTDPAHPPTELFVQPIDDNTTYSVIVYDQDIHGNKTAAAPAKVIYSGDTHKPIFGGINSVTNGVGISNNHAEETTLRLNFVPIAVEPGDINGATDYIAYVTPGLVNACNLTTGYQFYHALDFTPNDPLAFIRIDNLTPLTTYSVCLKARDAAGNLSDNIVSFTKSTLDITPPPFDGVQTIAYDREKAELVLGWNPSSANDLYEFKIRLWKGIAADPDQAVSLTTTVRANIAGTGTRIKQSTFAMGSGELIHALVEACDNAGSVAGGTQNCSVHDYTFAKTVTLADIDPPPGFLGIKSATDLISTTEGVITVKWVAPSDWTDYKGFKVYYVNQTTNEIESMAKDCPCAAVSCPIPVTQCDLIGLDPYRNYRLHVRAYDVAGNMTILDPAAYSTTKRAADTHAPTFTSNLQLAFANGKASLQWGHAADNQYAQEPGADITYEVYRKVDEAFTFNPADNTDPGYPSADVLSIRMVTTSDLVATSWVDTGATFVGGKTYYYTVCAVDSTGNRYCDGTVKQFLCPDLIPPTIGAFTSTKTPDGYLWDLNWTAADNVTNNANLQYKIYQRFSAVELENASTDDNLVYIATGTPTYTNLRGPLNANTWVHYMLVVLDADGNKATRYLTLYAENKITLSSVRSQEGPISGGKKIILIGEGFKPDLTVKIGNSTCSAPTRYSKKHLICTTPISVDPGAVTVSVTNPDTSAGQLTNGYSYCTGAGCTNVCNKSPASWGSTGHLGAVSFAAGAGTSVNPWVMCTVDHLNAIRLQPYGKYYKLGDNIDLQGVTFAPLYNSNGSGVEFQGGLDGDHYIISNWTYNNGVATTPVGLFQYMTNSTIKDVGVVNFNVTGKDRVGMFAGTAGYAPNNTFTNNNINGLFVIGTVTGQNNVGGAIGTAGATLSNVSVIGNVNGIVTVGGIAGYKNDGASALEFSGAVVATAAGNTSCNLGGIFGYGNSNNYTMTGLKTSGTVTCTDVSGNGANQTGGLVGFGNYMKFEDSENRADVTSNGGGTAGIVGQSNATSNFTNVKNYGNIIANGNNVGGFIGYNSFGNNNFTDVANYGNVTVPSSRGSTGGFAGALEGNGCCVHKFTNAVNYGKIISGFNAGGIIGNSNFLTFLNVTNYGDITTSNSPGGSSNTGGIVGSASNSTIKGAINYGNVSGIANYIGGVVGAISGNISDSSSSGTISGGSYVGGIAGLINGTSSFGSFVTNSESSANVQNALNGNNVGGIVGALNSGSSSNYFYVEKSRFTGKVSGGARCGGIIGETNQYNIIRRNKSSGSIDCTTIAGGVVGVVNANNLTVELNAASGTVKGLTYAGGFVGFAQRAVANAVVFNDNYTKADVKGNDAVGGFVGSGGPIFNRCWASGKLTSIDTQSRFGGFAGELYGTGSVSTSFWDKTASGFVTSPLGIGSTTGQMLGTTLYTTNGYLTTNWSFTAFEFPKLLWEVP